MALLRLEIHVGRESVGRYEVEEVDADPDTPPAVLTLAINAEYRHQLVMAIVGLVVIVLGFVLLLLGIAGSVNWHLRFGALNSELSNAAPGVVAMIVGLVIIVVRAPKVSLHKG